MKYLVAIPVPEPWSTKLSLIKASLRPAGWRDTMEPHITFLAPDTPLLPPDEAAAAFKAAPISSSSITFSSREIAGFSRRHARSLVLVPDHTAPFQILFSSLVLGATWQATGASTRRPYQPHITLVNQVPNYEASNAEAQLNKRALDVRFDCNVIALYAKQSKWRQWLKLAERHLV